MNNKHFVTRTISFNRASPENESKASYIAYGTDSNFMLGCAISIASIVEHNSSGFYVFYVFTNSIDDDFIDKFEALSVTKNCTINICLLDKNSLDQLPTNKLWSSAIYYRFVIADYFESISDKVLYLDSDVICQNSILELTQIDLKDNICAAVLERDSDWWAERALSLNNKIIQSGYFNSGVMLINTRQWKRKNITQRAMDILSDCDAVKKLSYYDQDVLNMVCAGEVIFLAAKFNAQYSINYELRGVKKNPVNKDTIFIHYIGPTKPWHIWANYQCCQPFIDIKSNSPWKDTEKLAPVNTSQWRYAAKHFFKQKKYILFICYYYRYFLAKLN